MHVSMYIGHHKVGSTSLQIFLSQNARRLLAAGLLYPFTEMIGAAHAVRRAVRGDRAEVPPVNVREPHSALAYRMMADTTRFVVPKQFQKLPHSSQMLHAVSAQVQALAPKGLILCSEAFSNFGMINPELVTKLCEQFPGATFTVYCALRRPDEYMMSWHNQRIKVLERVQPLSSGVWQDYVPTIHFDYRLAVGAWLERVPGTDKRLRNYRDVLASGGSEADYMAHSGLDFPKAGMLPAAQANKGLQTAVLELARLGNEALEPADARHLVQFLMQLDRKIDLPRNSDIECFGEEHRREIHARFAPIHDWLGEVSGKAPFFPDFDQVLETRPIPEREALRQVLDRIGTDLLAPLPAPARAFVETQKAEFRP